MTLYFVAVGALFWIFVCNMITHYQRGRIIDFTFEYNMKMINEGRYNLRLDPHPVDRISYNRHMWLLFTLRNPMKRYNLNFKA